MGVLDRLRIPSDIDDESEEEYTRDLRADLEEDQGKSDPIPADSPFRDPAPGESAKSKAPRRPRTEPPRVTKKHVEAATEEIETFLQAIALAWGWQAPPCGRALEEAAPDMAAKFAKLASRNPAWLLKIREGGLLADAVACAIATKPVISAAYTHYTQPREESGNGVEFDPSKFPAYSGNGA